jgi:Family of unknown function (DUF6165)
VKSRTLRVEADRLFEMLHRLRRPMQAVQGDTQVAVRFGKIGREVDETPQQRLGLGERTLLEATHAQLPQRFPVVFDRVHCLRTCSTRRPRDMGALMNIFAPISVGELIDKITILRIKLDKIRDPAAQANIRRELDQLIAIRAGARLEDSALAPFEEQLSEVNRRLWDVEDELRALENTGDFGSRFVELARSVYRLNDRRTALKRSINAVSGSAIVEEKSYTSYRDIAAEVPEH